MAYPYYPPPGPPGPPGYPYGAYSHSYPYAAPPPPPPGVYPPHAYAPPPPQATLGYDLPALSYQPQASMEPWDLARALYTGARLERSVFDTLLAEVPNFFGTRHLKEREARKAHRRIYVLREADRNSKHYGGAAAFQAYLLWERDHYAVFTQYAPAENRDRLVAMALAEVYSLFERHQPAYARLEESCEWAAATAKHLFDLHYDSSRPRRDLHGHSHSHSYSHSHSPYPHAYHYRRYDDSSDSDAERPRRRDPAYAYGYAPGAYPPPPPPPPQQYPYAPYAAGYAYPPIDPMTGYPYRTDAYGNPLPESRSWYYGYGRY